MPHCRTIATMLFLAIMGMLMFHNAIPHVHNQAHDHHAAHGVVSDSDRHHHHHHPSNEHQEEQSPNKENSNNLIQILLEIHVEGYHVNELIESRLPGTSDLGNCSMHSKVLDSGFTFCRSAKSSRLYVEHNLRCKPKLYLENSALRAPPRLG